MKNTSEFRMGLEGFYKVAVVDVDGNEVWKQPEWRKNLILNQGMNILPSYHLAEVLRYAVAGTGSRVNSITSSASSASVINGGLALNPQAGGIQNFDTEIWGGWSGSLATGDTIQFANGTEVAVGSVGATSCAVTPTDTVTSQSFTIWKTSQTAMHYEKKRGGTGVAGSAYLTGTGNCGSSIAANVVTYLRTYDFAIETSPTTYTEVGVAWQTTGSSTFSRIMLPVTVSIDTGQRLRLVYQLQATFLPTSSQYVTNATVNGWPVTPATNTNMTESIQLLQASSVDTSGNSSTTYAPLEPAGIGSVSCAFWASTNSESIVAFGATPPDRDSFGSADVATSTADVYVQGSYTLYKNATFGLSRMNYQNLRSFGFGSHNPASRYAYRSSGQAFAMLFEQSQSKYNTQTLSFTYQWTWSRVLA